MNQYVLLVGEGFWSQPWMVPQWVMADHLALPSLVEAEYWESVEKRLGGRKIKVRR